MNVDVTKSKESTESLLPRLMEDEDGMIILATGINTDNNFITGTVVFPCSVSNLGEYSDTWSFDEFKQYTGKITLVEN